jgi:AraC-like DNA-binding protein
MSDSSSRKIVDSANIYQDFETRFYEWEDGMSSAGFKLELPDNNRDGFDWGVTGYNFGRVIGGVLTVSEHDINRQYGNLFSMPDHIVIFIVIIGGMDVQCFGRRFQMTQGDILIQDMSQPIQIRVYPGDLKPRLCTYQYIIMPKHSLHFNVDIASLHGKHILASSPVNIILRNHFATMVQVFDQMTEQEVLSTGEGAASVFLQTLHLVAGKKVEHPFEQSARLERICLHIEKHIASPISVDAMCKSFAISRSGLYRLFEPLGGIAQFVRNRRLLLAKRLLRSSSMSDHSLAAIARQCGLELSALRRYFNEVYGATPKEMRERFRQAEKLEGQTDATHVNWVSSL